MRINNQNFNYNNRTKIPQSQSFTGVLHIDPKTGNINDSWFFRDQKTLETSAKHIKTYFPDGADILDYACSTGEEEISLKALMPQSKYRVIGYDNSADALRIGKRGVYTLFSGWFDSYLLPNSSFLELEGKSPTVLKQIFQKTDELRKKFHEIMYEVPPSREYRDINNKCGFSNLKYRNKNFVQKFYRVRDEFKDQLDLRYGNFLNVGQVRKERPVGAIFFRNAIYHLCRNDINEILDFNMPVHNITDKKHLMERLIDGVYKTLDDNGIFVIGNHIKEHLFIADDTLPASKTARLENTPFYNPNNIHHQAHKSLKCFKESPLISALYKGGRFVPIEFSKVVSHGCEVVVPVVFKKVKIWCANYLLYISAFVVGKFNGTYVLMYCIASSGVFAI